MTTSGKLRRLLLVARLVGVALVPSAATAQRPVVSMGGAGATAEFRYFRVHRP